MNWFTFFSENGGDADTTAGSNNHQLLAINEHDVINTNVITILL